MPREVKEEGLVTKGHGNQGWGWVGECSDEIVSCLDDIGGYIGMYLSKFTELNKNSILQAFQWGKKLCKFGLKSPQNKFQTLMAAKKQPHSKTHVINAG